MESIKAFSQGLKVTPLGAPVEPLMDAVGRTRITWDLVVIDREESSICCAHTCFPHISHAGDLRTSPYYVVQISKVSFSGFPPRYRALKEFWEKKINCFYRFLVEIL